MGDQAKCKTEVKGDNVWLVKHREGWCAVDGNEPHDGTAFHVPILCGMEVTLPGDIAKGTPDCGECLNALRTMEADK